MKETELFITRVGYLNEVVSEEVNDWKSRRQWENGRWCTRKCTGHFI